MCIQASIVNNYILFTYFPQIFSTGCLCCTSSLSSSCLEDHYKMVYLKIYSYGIGSVPWQQVRDWELCPGKHSSRLSLSPTTAPGRRVSDSSARLLLRRTEDTVCPPGLLPWRASCLSGAWIWDVVERLLRLVQPLDCHPLLLFLTGANDTVREICNISQV